MKTIISLIFCLVLYPEIIRAQEVSLKHPLSKADYASLDKAVKECFSYEPTIGFTFQLEDFYDNKNLKPDKPNSLRQIRELEKKIKGNNQDAPVYTRMGEVYKGLFMMDEAYENFKKALDLATEYVNNNPDSSNAYIMFGIAHMNLGNLIEAGMAFQRSCDMNENDSIAKTMLMTCYLFSGNFESALSMINEMISGQPCNLENYGLLLLTIYFKKYTELGKLSRDDLESSLKGKSAEEILDLTGLKAVEALRMDPDLFNAYLGLTALDIISRDTKNAGDKLNTMFRTEPNNSNLYILQGICMLLDNDISTAYTSFQIARRLVDDPTWITSQIIDKYFVVKAE